MINKQIEKGRLELEETVHILETKLEREKFDSAAEREKITKMLERKIEETVDKVDALESSIEGDITEVKEDLEGAVSKIDSLEEKVEVIQEELEENKNHIE